MYRVNVTTVRNKLGYRIWKEIKNLIDELSDDYKVVVLKYAEYSPYERKELYERLKVAVAVLKTFDQLRENYIKAIDKVFRLGKGVAFEIIFKLDKEQLDRFKERLKY